jgi:hypothetical protein
MTTTEIPTTAYASCAGAPFDAMKIAKTNIPIARNISNVAKPFILRWECTETLPILAT